MEVVPRRVGTEDLPVQPERSDHSGPSRVRDPPVRRLPREEPLQEGRETAREKGVVLDRPVIVVGEPVGDYRSEHDDSRHRDAGKRPEQSATAPGAAHHEVSMSSPPDV